MTVARNVELPDAATQRALVLLFDVLLMCFFSAWMQFASETDFHVDLLNRCRYGFVGAGLAFTVLIGWRAVRRIYRYFCLRHAGLLPAKLPVDIGMALTLVGLLSVTAIIAHNTWRLIFG